MGVVVVTHRSRRRPIPGAEAKLRALSIHWRPLHFLNAIERLQAKALAEGSNGIRSAGTYRALRRLSFRGEPECLGARTSILKAVARRRSWVRATAVAIGCMSFAHCRRQRPSRSSGTCFPSGDVLGANCRQPTDRGVSMRPPAPGTRRQILQLFDDHLANIFHRCVRRTGEFYMTSHAR